MHRLLGCQWTLYPVTLKPEPQWHQTCSASGLVVPHLVTGRQVGSNESGGRHIRRIRIPPGHASQSGTEKRFDCVASEKGLPAQRYFPNTRSSNSDYSSLDPPEQNGHT